MASAPYPDIPEVVHKATNAMMEAARVQSDIAWLKAVPIIEKEAKEGKPYVPFAGRPTDLLQSEIVAFFPDAEGGGTYSFGGRGETYVGRRDDAMGGNPIGNIMIDHVSASWGLDENMSMYHHMYKDSTVKAEIKLGTVNITIQNSICYEALDTLEPCVRKYTGWRKLCLHT
ncbi:Pectate lyase [Arcticibacter svalbardensis MN12-7]|uniref:Pectate lyase n=1 Tax=Arcticibacter svalbardensis MN12-7 TaxID=1150600 RepID=R9GNE0_9SPHI|nr:Pectate lyase [Arcticibacter svalbardensis MN12-7]